MGEVSLMKDHEKILSKTKEERKMPLCGKHPPSGRSSSCRALEGLEDSCDGAGLHLSKATQWPLLNSPYFSCLEVH